VPALSPCPFSCWAWTTPAWDKKQMITMNESDFVFICLLRPLFLGAKKKNIFRLFKSLAAYFSNFSLFG
jgi:hypothetical protein